MSTKGPTSVERAQGKKKTKKRKPQNNKSGGTTSQGTLNGAEDHIGIEEDDCNEETGEAETGKSSPITNGITAGIPNAALSQSEPRSFQDDNTSKSSARLDALVDERDKLCIEVAELRKSLEELREVHEKGINDVQKNLADSQKDKETAETSYKNLLGKVNQIKSQLGEKLKSDAEELERTRSQIDDLEEQNKTLSQTNKELNDNQKKVIADSSEQVKEITGLRDRVQRSQQNWTVERDDLICRERQAREELEAAKNAMQDWEVLAMEERNLRENLAERVAEQEERLASQLEAHRKLTGERDVQFQTVEGLQRALSDIQEERKRELRELVEGNQKHTEQLTRKAEKAELDVSSTRDELRIANEELKRISPFEKEIKEKNLLIGKLRHEAVILNDHLTKALRFLKKGNPEDNVDRQIVTNHLLQFLALDRSDPKKFQILQLISALLGWDEEQREQAGLARPTISTSSLRVPLSPFRRSPSQQSISTDLLPEASMNSRESLAELWSNFLNREAQEGNSEGYEIGAKRQNTVDDLDELKSPKST